MCLWHVLKEERSTDNMFWEMSCYGCQFDCKCSQIPKICLHVYCLEYCSHLIMLMNVISLSPSHTTGQKFAIVLSARERNPERLPKGDEIHPEPLSTLIVPGSLIAIPRRRLVSTLCLFGFTITAHF